MYKKMSAARKSELDIAVIKIDQSKQTIFLSGSWGWSSLDEAILAQFFTLKTGEWLVDGSNISNIDTTGFYFVHKLIRLLTAAKSTVSKVVLLPEDQVLYDLTKSFELRSDNTLNDDQGSNFLSKVGEGAAELWHTCLQLTAFFGQLCNTVATLFKRDYPLYVKGIIETISTAGIKGVLISSMLCFLIGVNLTYQMAPQFVTYGANIYVVNFLGISLLREVTPYCCR
jgi:phospholipid/cholesterol/gamma-HCH transport system permease protein